MKEYKINIPVSSYEELKTSCIIIANCGVKADNIIEMMKRLFNSRSIIPTRNGLVLNELNTLNGTIPDYSVDVFKSLMHECFPDKKYELEEIKNEDDEDEEENVIELPKKPTPNRKTRRSTSKSKSKK